MSQKYLHPSVSKVLLHLLDKLQHHLLGDNSPPRVDSYLHAADLLVDILHELDDEIYELVFPHPLQMRMGHQKADMVSLVRYCACMTREYATKVRK